MAAALANLWFAETKRVTQPRIFYRGGGRPRDCHVLGPVFGVGIVRGAHVICGPHVVVNREMVCDDMGLRLSAEENPRMVHRRPISEFSNRELLHYADEHVLYEITQFIRAAQTIDTARSGVFPMNFAIEVFALHLRNLLDFFAAHSERKTDASAKNFHREWQSPKLNLYLEEARWMADKHVAHLTTDRTTDADLKEWAIEPIRHSMIPIIDRFPAKPSV